MKNKILDRAGHKYGRLTAVSEAPRNKHNQVMWNCECECGEKLIVSSGNLSRNKSCGCLAREQARARMTGTSSVKNKIGQKYGKLTITMLDRVEEKNGIKRSYWISICECGKEAVKRSDAFGKHSSCGCSPYRDTAQIEGFVFGRLTAIRQTDIRDSSGNIKWECLCSCGNTSFVSTGNLNSGTSKSCGCLGKEKIQQQGLKNKGEANGMFGMLREKHPVWVGGRSENDIERKSQKYRGI